MPDQHKVVTSLNVPTGGKSTADKSKVSSGKANHYHVTAVNGMDFADIFLIGGKRAADEHWGTVCFTSTFGEGGHTFTNMGPRTLKQFLTRVDFSYLSQKVFGERARVLDAKKSLEGMRKTVLDALSEAEITEDAARELNEALDTVERSNYHNTSEFTHAIHVEAGEAFMRLELWHDIVMMPNPQAVGFWEEIWLPFVRTLLAEASTGSPVAA